MSNRHTLFVSIKPIMLRSTPGEQDPVLETLRSEIENYHQQLQQRLTPFPLELSKLGKFVKKFKQKTNQTPRDYLSLFIETFEQEKSLVFTEAVRWCDKKHSEYQKADRQAKKLSIHAEQITEAPELTQQELDWDDLLKTFKRCVNSFSTSSTTKEKKGLSWHPDHLLNFYRAAVRLKWQRYENNYDQIELYHRLTDNNQDKPSDFSLALAHEIAEERRQIVIAQHTEDVKSFEQYIEKEMRNSPEHLIKKQREKFNREAEQQKTTRFDAIKNTLLPEFIKYAESIITFIKKPADQSVLEVYHEAITEIKRWQSPTASNPAFFKPTINNRYEKDDLVATLGKVTSSEMQKYNELFEAEIVAISKALESIPSF